MRNASDLTVGVSMRISTAPEEDADLGGAVLEGLAHSANRPLSSSVVGAETHRAATTRSLASTIGVAAAETPSSRSPTDVAHRSVRICS